MWSMDSILSSKPSSRMPFPPGEHPQPPTAPTLYCLPAPLTPEQYPLESPQWTPKPYFHMPGPSQWTPKAEPSFQWMPGPLQSVNHKSSYRMPGSTLSRKSHSHPYLMSAMPRKVLQEVPDDGNRFPQPATVAELSELCKQFVPEKTQQNNNWAVSVFMKWIQARNVHTGSSTGNTFPTNILEMEQPCSVIDQILAAFVFEAIITLVQPYETCWQRC